jgi:hypothetical protein
MVASTVPSTTRVSQSVISTPLSLMLGPTVSLLPGESCDAAEAWRGADEELATLEEGVTAPAGLPPVPAVPMPLPRVLREVKASLSRLPKNGF